jgi:peptidoglycan/LPS O-acetylase OafA/YrhL
LFVIFGFIIPFALYKGFLWHLHRVRARELFAHLGYLNGFFAYRWGNSVYWTLAIELQYYLVIALVFPVSQRVHAVT